MNEINLSDMLQARELRVQAQEALIQTHQAPLICLTLNIPGSVKVFSGIPALFASACNRIEAALAQKQISILGKEFHTEATGYEGFYSVSDDPSLLKECMVRIEDADSVGRLLDIDIIKIDGMKVSREELGLPARRCLLCDQSAHVCSRSRTHRVDELVSHICDTIQNKLESEAVLSYLDTIVRSSLLAEVSTTPKPGLVDRNDSGAHKDMNFKTFEASTAAIVPYLTQMADLGLHWEPSLEELFHAIRPLGIQAETAMYRATRGVNTHKGLIFSLGIIMAASGYYYKEKHTFCADSILLLCQTMTAHSLEQDFLQIDRSHPKTHGEKLYLAHGCKGIRGEAGSGFPSIRNIALPAIRKLSQQTTNQNHIYIHTLLTLMAQVDDTNVLIRTDYPTLLYVKKEAKRIIALGGGTTLAGLEALVSLNEDFINRNISPGGCADLLAVTIFMKQLESDPTLLGKTT